MRYLLVLTQQQSAYSILFSRGLLDQRQTEIFVGSAFPRDQSYAQICRKINRIKVCMETGRTVLLLNMESLYESLHSVQERRPRLQQDVLQHKRQAHARKPLHPADAGVPSSDGSTRTRTQRQQAKQRQCGS